ncbi:MAG TPA: DUF6141 family protein [Candidatus Hydrogenedens sp.]|nr:DUF6141 family protein [Candidatus Hydrogenedens sp.]
MNIKFEKVKKKDLPPDSELLFIETQRFSQWWFWLIITLSIFLAIAPIGYGLVQQLIFKQPWGNNPMPDLGLILTALCMIIFVAFILYFFYMIRLETRVYKDGIYIIYYPFHLKYRKLSWDKLDEISGHKYRPIVEFGGWGIRWNAKGWAYTVSGNECIELKKGNHKIVIGTKKLDELLSALDKAQNLCIAESYLTQK